MTEVEEERHMSAKKILIVDDNKDFLRGLNIRLSACGYRVAYAADAISALSMARKEEPDLVLLDVGLPCGDGFTVMERLSSISSLASIPVIVITGRDTFCNQQRALDAGARDFFQKPVDNDVLLGSIREALSQNR